MKLQLLAPVALAFASLTWIALASPQALRAEIHPAASPPGPALPARVDDGAPDEARQALHRARTWRGRVSLPAGAGRDDSSSVVLLGGPRPESDDAPGDRSWHRREVLARAAVGADGAFEVTLPAAAVPRFASSSRTEGSDVPSLALDLDGRHAYLEEPLELDPHAGAAPLVLAAELGGSIRGTLVLPPGTSEVPQWIDVGCFGMHFGGAGMSRAVTLEGTLEFELRALQAGLRYKVWANTSAHPGSVLEEELEVDAGQTTSTSLRLELGALVRGRVVDPDGTPLAGAQVVGDSGSVYSIRMDAGTALTDADGRFELLGLAPREQALSAWVEGFVEAESPELQLGEGTRVDDLEIVLAPGAELRGSVHFPSGEPAAGARLTVVPLDASTAGWRMIERARDEDGSARSGADGSFRVAGLVPGEYAVFAELVTQEAAGRVAWSARRASVAAETSDLALELVRPALLRGQVVDDAGQPVEDFTVTARRTGWPTWVDGPSCEAEVELEATGGAFELDSLDPGEWTLSVYSPTHLSPDDRAATAPSDVTEPFVLTRTGRIAGRVLDPAGHPVADAEVRANAESNTDAGWGRSGTTRTDADGRYELVSLGPGIVTVQARSDEWAPSVEERHDLEPGDVLDEHDISLARGGTLVGSVLDGEGAPAAGRTVVVHAPDGEMHETQSDPTGRFRFEHLMPGAHQVVAMPDAWMDGSSDMGEMFEDVAMALATLVEDETVEVVLGRPATAPVTVHGRVLRDGVGVGGADLMVVAENGRSLEGLSGDTADGEGSFEVTLDEPGGYTFVLVPSGREGGIEHQVDFQVTVPEVERHELDLELPAGSIEAHVTGPDGSPVDGGIAWVRREDGTSDLAAMLGRGGEMLEEDGSLLVEGLHAGMYALTVASDGTALCTVHGVTVPANGGRARVEVALSAPGPLRGVVVDESGAPVPDALVQVRDAQGALLYRVEGQSDAEGAFELPRVPAGEVYVTARTADRATTAAVRVDVLVGTGPGEGREGAEEVKLVLAPAVLLEVALEDADGHPLRAAVRVEDAAGHDHAGSASDDELQNLFGQGVDAWVRRIGPLAPGRYEVHATAPDGRSARATISLSPAPVPQRETLQLD